MSHAEGELTQGAYSSVVGSQLIAKEIEQMPMLQIGNVVVATVLGKREIAEDNAKRMVTCWNSHDDLVAALELSRIIVDMNIFVMDTNETSMNRYKDELRKIDAALTKAKQQLSERS